MEKFEPKLESGLQSKVQERPVKEITECLESAHTHFQKWNSANNDTNNNIYSQEIEKNKAEIIGSFVNKKAVDEISSQFGIPSVLITEFYQKYELVVVVHLNRNGLGAIEIAEFLKIDYRKVLAYFEYRSPTLVRKYYDEIMPYLNHGGSYEYISRWLGISTTSVEQQYARFRHLEMEKEISIFFTLFEKGERSVEKLAQSHLGIIQIQILLLHEKDIKYFLKKQFPKVLIISAIASKYDELPDLLWRNFSTENSISTYLKIIKQKSKVPFQEIETLRSILKEEDDKWYGYATADFPDIPDSNYRDTKTKSMKAKAVNRSVKKKQHVEPVASNLPIREHIPETTASTFKQAPSIPHIDTPALQNIEMPPRSAGTPTLSTRKKHSKQKSKPADLSPRDILNNNGDEVASLLSQGVSKKEIADKYNVPELSVDMWLAISKRFK